MRIQILNFILFTDSNSSCAGIDITLDALTCQLTEHLKDQVAEILNHSNGESDTTGGETRTLIMCRLMPLYH